MPVVWCSSLEYESDSINFQQNGGIKPRPFWYKLRRAMTVSTNIFCRFNEIAFCYLYFIHICYSKCRLKLLNYLSTSIRVVNSRNYRYYSTREHLDWESTREMCLALRRWMPTIVVAVATCSDFNEWRKKWRFEMMSVRPEGYLYCLAKICSFPFCA